MSETKVKFCADPVKLLRETAVAAEAKSALPDEACVLTTAPEGYELDLGCLDELQAILEKLGTPYLSGTDRSCGTDFLWRDILQNWVATAEGRDKAKYRFILRWISRMGRTPVLGEGEVVVAKKPRDSSPKDSSPKRSVSDPTRWKMVVGKVLKVWEHDNSDKLWCEEIDLGEESGPRRIGSGLRQFVKKEDFEGALVIVLANMKEKKLGGFPSHGMVVCASNDSHDAVELLIPPTGSQVGDLVTFQGLTGQPDDILTSKKNADTIASVMDILKTDDNCIATAGDGHQFLVRGLPVTSKTLKNAHVG
ncbi:putative tRNA-binding domain protein [Gregarina niphandrodes]|uniref:tRNA-binding domain protein n=1 Tax=Gregarina niphandrodes TaxID=110365 RepID=A0A023BB75_GRENI|nr:putative tRNA-binding domain protein [Gregarina niphandrodes]EZG78801.1 putative tRNA-binding domain protein [Gregarina niphandrodes]|eukprot:XP_011129192.1 putative tRNA-binding domain protein [Gregarina niphandrodes]